MTKIIYIKAQTHHPFPLTTANLILLFQSTKRNEGKSVRLAQMLASSATLQISVFTATG